MAYQGGLSRRMQYYVLGMKAPFSDDSLLKGDFLMKRFDIFSRIKTAPASKSPAGSHRPDDFFAEKQEGRLLIDQIVAANQSAMPSGGRFR